MLLAEELPNNYTAALLVWENVWATRFLEAVQDAGGVMVANARVPHDVVLAAIEAANWSRPPAKSETVEEIITS